MKNYFLKILLVVNALIISIPILAFPGDPDGGEDPPYVDPMPIDNYVWILIFLALCLGAARTLKYKESRKTG